MIFRDFRDFQKGFRFSWSPFYFLFLNTFLDSLQRSLSNNMHFILQLLFNMSKKLRQNPKSIFQFQFPLIFSRYRKEAENFTSPRGQTMQNPAEKSFVIFVIFVIFRDFPNLPFS